MRTSHHLLFTRPTQHQFGAFTHQSTCGNLKQSMRNAGLHRTCQRPKRHLSSIYIYSRLIVGLTAQVFAIVYTLDNGLFGHFEKQCCHLSPANQSGQRFRCLKKGSSTMGRDKAVKLSEQALDGSILIWYNSFQQGCVDHLPLTVLC